MAHVKSRASGSPHIGAISFSPLVAPEEDVCHMLITVYLNEYLIIVNSGVNLRNYFATTC